MHTLIYTDTTDTITLIKKKLDFPQGQEYFIYAMRDLYML